jgi:glycosyltransferase involved in cell wall biosynthesis
MKALFVLPGLHKYSRGAEIAFISIANELAKAGTEVTLIGAGAPESPTAYNYIRARCLARERFEAFPSLPLLRSEWAYEELTFAPSLFWKYRPASYDVTVTCSYPFTNWILRRPALTGRRPYHVFVTQNGDWPAYARNSEYRFFGCDGLVCTNPDFYDRNKSRWRCQIIPNGVDCSRFQPGRPERETLGLPSDRLIVLMVSALIPSKRVEVGIEAISSLPNAHLVVAGDGPQRRSLENLAANTMPGRFTRLSLTSDKMASLYRSADVFLHLSRDEPFGNVFVEAMACGLPIVAHDSPRSRWIVGDDEFLLDTGDPLAVAAAVTKASSARGANLESRVARAAEFSWPKIGQMYRQFLTDIVDGRS